jgi:hypothetical protein
MYDKSVANLWQIRVDFGAAEVLKEANFIG